MVLFFFFFWFFSSSLQAHNGDLTVRPTCKPGFSEEDYTALVSPNLMERQQFLKGRKAQIWKWEFFIPGVAGGEGERKES